MKAPQAFFRLVSKQSSHRKHTKNYVIIWLFLYFVDITSATVLKLYFSNSDLKISCVFEEKYKQLKVENMY